MSCGLQDTSELERHGLPAVLVHTDGFNDSAPKQAEMLGQPGLRRAIVPHPVQDKTASQIIELAQESLASVLGALVEQRLEVRMQRVGRAGRAPAE